VRRLGPVRERPALRPLGDRLGNQPRGVERGAWWRLQRCGRFERGIARRAQQPLQIRVGDPSRVGRLDRGHALAGLLSLGRQELVWRNEALIEARAQIAHV
jgi:hypothetical protein